MSENARKSVALIQSQSDMSRLTAAPPGIAAEKLAILIDAYRKAMNDPASQDRATKLGYPVEPAFGDDVRKIVETAL
jgi:tripartite-type tricarboxylate transporter receptor subunit TctC